MSLTLKSNVESNDHFIKVYLEAIGKIREYEFNKEGAMIDFLMVYYLIFGYLTSQLLRTGRKVNIDKAK